MKPTAPLNGGSLLDLHCRVFMRAAQTGSFSKAAKFLSMTVSSVSYHLSELEKQVGVTLIDRQQKPAKLTAEGKILLEELLLEEGHMAKVLNQLRSESFIKPAVRFGIVESLSRNLGFKILRAFAPEASAITLLTGTSERLFEELEKREIDFAICTKRSENPAHVEKSLFWEPSVLILPKSVGFTGRNPTWEDLKFLSLPLLRYNRESGGNKITEAMLQSLSLHLPTRIEVDDGGVMLKMVEEGLGWSLVRPATLIQHPQFLTRLTILPMPAPILDRNVRLVFRKGEEKEWHERLVIIGRDFFVNSFRPQIIEIAPWLQEYFQALEGTRGSKHPLSGAN